MTFSHRYSTYTLHWVFPRQQHRLAVEKEVLKKEKKKETRKVAIAEHGGEEETESLGCGSLRLFHLALAVVGLIITSSSKTIGVVSCCVCKCTFSRGSDLGLACCLYIDIVD